MIDISVECRDCGCELDTIVEYKQQGVSLCAVPCQVCMDDVEQEGISKGRELAKDGE